MIIRLADNDVINLVDKRLSSILKQQPKLEPYVYHTLSEKLATKEDVEAVQSELREFRTETNQRFDKVDKRFDKVERQAEEFRAETNQRFEEVYQRFDEVDQRFDKMDQRFDKMGQRIDSLETRMETGFKDLHKAIDRLGSRWGIRNESIFRQTMAELLEKSFGLHVEERIIKGDQFDVVIYDGEHILVEITASAGPKIQRRLERKKQIYIEATGVVPARVILVTASIHSNRAYALKEAGFEVIEPEID